jgi:hypothetical protein
MPYPQDIALLMGLSRGYSPMARGIPYAPQFGFEGTFLGGQGSLGMLGQMLAPSVRNLMGQVGMAPLGFGHDQNVFDVMQAQRFTQLRWQMMTDGARGEQQNYLRTIRGLHAAAGMQWTPEMERTFAPIAGAAGRNIAPMLALMNPQLLDALAGPTGSDVVMRMRMVDASRYRMDPVTGQMGLSRETLRQQLPQVFERLYGGGDAARMHGITAGDAGSLYAELGMRGLIPGAAAMGRDTRSEVTRALREMGPQDAAAAARRVGVGDMGRGAQLTAADIDRLALDPSVSDRIRAFDAGRIVRTIQSYSKVTAVMREIFGDMGHPNAPVPLLMASLDAMTSGGIGQLSPDRLATMARQQYLSAKNAGLTMDQMMLLQQNAAAVAGDLGLPSIMAPQLSRRAALFMQSSGGLGATGFGAMNRGELGGLDLNLTAQGAASPMANRMNLLMRLREAAPGGAFRAGSTAEAVGAAIARGQTSFRDPATGRVQSLGNVFMDDTSFMGMMRNTPGGPSEGALRAMLSQEQSISMEQGERYNTGDLVRQLQGPTTFAPHIAAFIREVLTRQLTAQLETQGVPSAKARQQAAVMAQQMAGRVEERIRTEVSGAQLADPESRRSAIARIIDDEMRKAPAAAGLQIGDRQAWTRLTAEMVYGGVNVRLQQMFPMTATRDKPRAWDNVLNVDRAAADLGRMRMQEDHQAAMMNARGVPGALAGGFFARTVGAVQRADINDPDALKRILFAGLGGVDKGVIEKQLMPQFEALRAEEAALNQQARELASEKDPVRRQALQDQLDQKYKALRNHYDRVLDMAKQAGLIVDREMTPEELAGLHAATGADAAVARGGGAALGGAALGGIGRAQSEALLEPIRKAGRAGLAGLAEQLGLRLPGSARLTPETAMQAAGPAGAALGTMGMAATLQAARQQQAAESGAAVGGGGHHVITGTLLIDWEKGTGDLNAGWGDDINHATGK